MPPRQLLHVKMAGAIFWAQIFFGVALAAIVFLSVDVRIARYHTRDAEEVAHQVSLAIDAAASDAAAREEVESLLPELARRHHLDGVRVELAGGALQHGVVEESDRFHDRPVSVRESHGHVVTVRPRSAGQGPIDDRKWLLLLVGALTLVTAVGLRRVLQRMISTPFLSMVGTARAFLEGNQSVRFDHTPENEFGYLARFINKALDRLEARQAELSWEASHDPLTGLANRREFERQLRDTLSAPLVPGELHAVLFADLDRFKPVNDEGGHQAGDALLQEIAGIFRSSVRASDVLARVGGDEFAILLRSCSMARAQVIAEDVLSKIRDLEFHWEEATFRVGISIGIADAQSGDALDAVVKAADDACYQAKHAGRNRVVLSVLPPSLVPPAS